MSNPGAPRVWQFSGLRLRHKLAISMVVAALLPVAVAYWVGANVVLRGLERGLREDTERQLDVGLNLLLRNIERLGHEATELSDSPILAHAIRKGPVALADALSLEAPHVQSTLVQIADEKGVIQAQQVLGGEVTRFRGLGVTGESVAVRSALTYERRVTVVRVGAQLVVRASAPIVDETFKLRGVAVLSVPLDGVFADSVKASLGSDVLILAGTAGDGQAMSTFLDPIGARANDVQISQRVLRRAASGLTAFEENRISDHSYELGHAPIYDLEGNIVGVFAVAADRAPLLAARGAATRSLALGVAGAFVFAIGLAGLLSRRISRPLQKLHVGAIAIARGDLDHDIHVAEGDEIGDLATAFAHMTTALKENQRRLAARMREIVALHDAGRAVSSVIELDQVLRKVVDSVARVLHVRVCALWLVRPGGNRDNLVLELGAARAKRADMRTILDKDEIADRVMPLLPLARDVAENRAPLHIESMGDTPSRAEIGAASGVDGSLVAAVLERKGAAVGVIIIGRGAGARPFSQADASLLSTFADQAATAIENASLYAEVRAFNEELEAKVKLRTYELTAINAELGRTITELRETQAQLTLSERLAGLGQLVAGVAHEINSPSAAIRGTADTLAETVWRITAKQELLGELVLTGAERRMLLGFFESMAPELAKRKRSKPAGVRRAAKELREHLLAQDVPEDIARDVAHKLSELGIDASAIGPVVPIFLRKDNLSKARSLVDYLADYVYLHRSTSTIQDAIRRIQRIVGSLKMYSHLEKDAARTLADLHEGIDNTLVIFEHLIARGISVQRNYGALPSVPIYIDELNQVWTNLIHNAIQAMHGEGRIDIETAVADGGVSVRIIDSGPGIPEDVMGRIFEPFFTTKAKGEGTGLGLGIVSQIVEKHGGRVTCESRPGRTCFAVWLPTAVDGQATEVSS